MAQGTRARDAVVSVPPGQRRVEDANTGSDRSWLAGDLVCFGSRCCGTMTVPPILGGEVVWGLVSIEP